ncbi:hypothetical protein SARC_00349 [Sphaeroforma arctica JP610]|uniref:Putative 2'-deoxynucleoside 5'-phosphate N-hydrolase 1 n=1 Tax=Sphaeroforma arctica JP610 TaxID=667725 RepID=A0A0L0GES6_9EUKA|nr:hypothetical protein SARC_00349 [Sphaeroforma arctica JP610]KNC87525.1 hypothetical protein SARC_00349 [Sphaeroforma arctica JP610]|eukprot:XP_014161427.1 hypothetical protein SARC_00349 [Sphaeroforma arctica JP610]
MSTPEKKARIYFAGSIRGGREDLEIYKELITYLQTKGTVLTEHIGLDDLDDLNKEKKRTDVDIWERDMEWLYSCDVIVAEVTRPSLGVGYELGIAEKIRKRVILLFRDDTGKQCSAMLTGNAHFKERITYTKVATACEQLDALL